ncbi:MAG: amidohydrolase family protein [Sediminibacterium sp.]|jgi:imidazolonepropionase-like amidohydrolase|nr:amidohydrolase family protein [Sediminibacterium sp.]
MKRIFLSLLLLLTGAAAFAQETFPVNGVRDVRSGTYAFTNATIIQNASTKIEKATLVIKHGKIVGVGVGVEIPKDAVVVDCNGKYIYPSFVDPLTDYGAGTPKRTNAGFNFGAPGQFLSNKPGAYNWNQAVKPEINTVEAFTLDEAVAASYRNNGFGTVFTHVKDGIVRGTGAVVTLAGTNENNTILKSKAAQVFSFDKGTSTQSYPSSLMGSIALIRQTYLDAKWYATKPATEGVNLSLEAFNANAGLPQIFVADDKWSVLRADRIAKEFGTQYILRGADNGYQRIDELAKTKATFIIGVDFPAAMDVEDPNDARFVSLADMKHWELAPTNPAAFEKAGIPFSITTAEMKDSKQFLANLRKAVQYGLSETKALEAITKTPATFLGVYDQVGSLDAGKWANFIITTEPVFSSNSKIVENWIQGNKYEINPNEWNNYAGKYSLVVNNNGATTNYALEVKKDLSASIIGTDTLTAKMTIADAIIKMSFPEKKGRMAETIRLGGAVVGNSWSGLGLDAKGNKVSWTANFVGPMVTETKKTSDSVNNSVKLISKVTYPFAGLGNEVIPQQETILIKNATVWTNEKEGKVANTDVLLKAGKIAKIGKDITEAGARVIDGTGKHLTPGIIDEHSHIAAMSINEGAQSVTSEVRVGDNMNPEDINIYRQLSGGVTTSHILHGSANTIGGQTQLIKLRWGASDDGIKFAGADPFIKFALGENVKRTTAVLGNNRFPDTRMGVEEMLTDAFDRAADYQKALKANPNTRRDLELEAISNIMNNKLFITCHSYVQTEITYAMRVIEQFNNKGYDFKVNTFTHILEGYKVADKMKKHGASAATFSDWFNYKTEVQDATAYNAAIMQRVGVNTIINSDDAEMARRLNQEAGKIVKYGGVSEDEAFKMVTLNPAKALHIDNKVGSIKVGKDADVVLWTDNPLSIYAKSLYTIVDGTVFFDRAKDAEKSKAIATERAKLIQKMLGEKKAGAPMRPAMPSYQTILSCGDHDHEDHLATVYETNKN